jgi:hypothetical protein
VGEPARGLTGATWGRSSVEERCPVEADAAGSSPVDLARVSGLAKPKQRKGHRSRGSGRRAFTSEVEGSSPSCPALVVWPRGEAAGCKPVHAGSTSAGRLAQRKSKDLTSPRRRFDSSIAHSWVRSSSGQSGRLLPGRLRVRDLPVPPYSDRAGRFGKRTQRATKHSKAPWRKRYTRQIQNLESART